MVISSRLVLDKEEREIRHTWGRWWPRMRKEQERKGGFYLLFGDWSGYQSSQYRITTIQYIKEEDVKNLKLHTVYFSDNTTMSVWVKKVTIETLLASKWKQRLTYTDLIRKAMATGKETYSVKGGE